MSCNRCYNADRAVSKSMGPINRMSSDSTTSTTATTPIPVSTFISVDDTSSQQRPICIQWDAAQADSILDGVERMYSKTSLLFSVAAYLLVTPFSVLWREVPQLIHNFLKAKEAVTVEDLLDAVGNYCSGQPLFDLWGNCKRMPSSIVIPLQQSHDELEPPQDTNIFTNGYLPAETTIHILTYLQPKDIVSSFGCVSKGNYNFVNGTNKDDHDDEYIGHESTTTNTITILLWKTIFERDYAWLVDKWDVGRQAKERSLQSLVFELHEPTTVQFSSQFYSRDFYFRFSLGYINYLLSGQNTVERCLIGLGGHIFDMTHFLSTHPGSLESVLVHAGKDATTTFERIGHTSRARRIAREKLCVVVNTNCVHLTNENEDDIVFSTGAVLQPTHNLKWVGHIDDDCNFAWYGQTVNPSLLSNMCSWEEHRMANHQSHHIPSIQKIRDEYCMELTQVSLLAIQEYGSEALGGEVNVYYDPFLSKWKAWYIDLKSFHNEFVDL